MVLVSLLLVLAAAVALVIGLLQSGLAIIYVSIGCSVVAGILLAVAVVRGRPERVATGPMGGPAPQPEPQPAPASQSWQSPQPDVEPAREREPAMAGAGDSPAPDSTQQLDQAAIEQAVRGDEGDVAIPDYDRLRATEVLPLLANLDANELAQVREHEVAGRNRFMVLSRVDRELEARGPVEDDASDAAASSEWDTGDEWDGTAESEAEVDDGVAAEADEEEAADDEQARRPAPAAVDRAPAASGSVLDNYEQLKVLEILPRLGDLNADELAQVRRREQAGQRRAMIINRVDRLIVDARPAPSAAASRRGRPVGAPPARRGPAKKAAVKKAPAKSASAPARKATAKKAAPTKASAKKAVRKQAAAKRAPAKKAAARASTPTEKRGGQVRKTTKATKATKATKKR